MMMAVDRKQFIHKVDIGIKADKNYQKFYFNFKVNGTIKQKILDYSDKDWDKRTRITKAKIELVSLKDKVANKENRLDDNIKLDTFAEMHFNTLPDTPWTTKKRQHYNNYIKKQLGNKKVTAIKQMDIKQCIQTQEEEGLKPRTIKTTLEIFNPLFKEAIANRIINFNPCTGINIKRPKTKKIVFNAGKDLKDFYHAISTLFKDDPFYLSLYLFAIQGKRKSEILKLKWENINFKTNECLLEDTKNGEHQVMHLPNIIKVELEKFRQKKGWIYESRRNPGQPINNIEKQTQRIKELCPNFTLHYLRNVLASIMGENGASPTSMSGALGHNNTSTLSKYLSINYKQGSKEADEIITQIIGE
jgi:integrase